MMLTERFSCQMLISYLLAGCHSCTLFCPPPQLTFLFFNTIDNFMLFIQNTSTLGWIDFFLIFCFPFCLKYFYTIFFNSFFIPVLIYIFYFSLLFSLTLLNFLVLNIYWLFIIYPCRHQLQWEEAEHISFSFANQWKG